MDYLRHVVDVSPAMFFRFASVLPFMNCRKSLPKEAWFAAQIAAVRQEDCGPCLQIAINLARKASVADILLTAIIENDRGAIPPEIQTVIDFTGAVLRADGTEEKLRQILKQRYGARGLIELAYVIAGSHLPPTIKRVLGYAQTCSRVQIGETSMAPATAKV